MRAASPLPPFNVAPAIRTVTVQLDGAHRHVFASLAVEVPPKFFTARVVAQADFKCSCGVVHKWSPSGFSGVVIRKEYEDEEEFDVAVCCACNRPLDPPTIEKQFGVSGQRTCRLSMRACSGDFKEFVGHQHVAVGLPEPVSHLSGDWLVEYCDMSEMKLVRS